MRIGFVLECHRDGADHKVMEHVVRALRGDLELLFQLCGSKRALFEDCGKQVEALFTVERQPNPKKTLNKLFNEHRRRDYDDKVHALKIIEKASLSKLERAPSFARLKDKLGRLEAL